MLSNIGEVNDTKLHLYLFVLFKCPKEAYLSAPGDWGWDAVLDKTCILDTLV